MKIEAEVSEDIRKMAGKIYIHLFRNNSGALVNPKTNIPVRFGLGNESAKLNKKTKSSDSIGWFGIQYGSKIAGKICSVESKREGWVFKGTDHEIAQKHWIDKVNEHGGLGMFATSAEEFRERVIKYVLENQ